MQSADDSSQLSQTTLATGRSRRTPTITIDPVAEHHDELSDPACQSSPSDVRISTDASIPSPESPSGLSVPDGRSRQSSVALRYPPSASSHNGTTLDLASSLSEYGRSRSPSGATTISVTSLREDDHLKRFPQVPRVVRVEDGPFSVSPGTLERMVEQRSLELLHTVGGLRGLAAALRTDCSSGISVEEAITDDNPERNQSGSTRAPKDPHAVRKRIFGSNRLPEKRIKSILDLMWNAFNDKVLLLLTIVATISLAVGLYQTFGLPHQPGQPKVEWVEGVTIMTAVVIVVVVGALNDYQKERQFANLNRKKEDRVVNVIRSGKSREISVYDVVVGDILHLEPGDLVPTDGVLISGHNVRCDESSISGESEQKKKTVGDTIIARMEAGGNVDKLDPFIISGSKVLEGTGTYMVTAVGMHSTYGKLMMSLTEETEATPLQMKLTVVADQIAIAGILVAALLFLVLFVKFLIELPGSTDSSFEKGQTFLQIVIVSITVVVIAVPEGLPLAVTLALAIAVTRMLKDNNLVRILGACETMGNATCICCDKTGTLTTNKMTVVAGFVGTRNQFRDQAAPARYFDEDDNDDSARNPVSVSDFISLLSNDSRNLMSQSIVINSTAFEGEENGGLTFIGSRTETALLFFAKERLGMGAVAEERANAKIVQIVPFDSSRKCMASVVELGGIFRLYVKGAPEILLDKCTQVVESGAMSEHQRDLLGHVIESYGDQSLRTIGLAYRDFPSWPPLDARIIEDSPDQALFEDISEHMTFIGVFGIQDPLRPGVENAIAKCHYAGVTVRMVTGDNIGTAKAIATKCGILTDGLIMDGPSFRQLSKLEMYQLLPRLQVLARSSPEDKRILVKRLKELGETVAVTGDGTNDGPALRTADVGFSMGISGTEIAREASSIILMDDNFASVIKAIEWGRAVNDAIKKFLQFQLTVNITAVTLTFVSAITSDSETSILTPVQLLWVNLIMDTFAALALATDPPAPSILDRKPEPKSAPLVSLSMWKMIVAQSIYQLAVTLALNFAGNRILGYTSEELQESLETVVFNTYVWMQFFNQFNNRRLDNKLNVFEGILKNWYFIGINLITIAGQVSIIFFGGSALSAVRLNGTQWAISLVLGAISLIVGVLVRLIPDDVSLGLIPVTWRKRFTPHIPVSWDGPSAWDEGREAIREELAFQRKRRTSRLGFRFLGGSETVDVDGRRSPSPYPSSSPAVSERRMPLGSTSVVSVTAAMAGIIAGSVAAWSPRG